MAQKIFTCRDVKDPGVNARCREASDACNGLKEEGQAASCSYQLANNCIANFLKGASSYPVETTGSSPVSFSDVGACFSAVVQATRSFGPLPQFRGQVADKKHPKDKPGKSPDETPPKREAGEGSFADKVCAGYSGGPGQTDRNSCAQIVGACASKGPFEFLFRNSRFSYPDSLSCMESAFTMIEIPFTLLPQRKKTEAAPEAEDAPSGEDNSPAADGKTKFEIPLDFTDFAPETGGEFRQTARLPANYKGRTSSLEIDIKYALEKTGPSSYKMKYSISEKDGGELCDERTVEFDKSEIENGKLYFAVTLRSEGNFKTASSVVILKK